MAKILAVVGFLTITMTQLACASYRVVPVARGVDSAGEFQQFYAVAHNNVIIPEYVVNERGEYPTDEKTAWERFQSRRAELAPKIKAKYKIPSDASYAVKKAPLRIGFFAISPISYPIYAISSDPGKRSPAEYFDLMVDGPSAETPKLKDELANF